MRGRMDGAAENAEVVYDQVFRALGDPHRLQIVELLSKKEMSAGEVLDSLDIVQSTLSHHMKTLTQAGVVIAHRHGKWVHYSVNLEVLQKALRRIGEISEAAELLLLEKQKAQAELEPGPDPPGENEKDSALAGFGAQDLSGRTGGGREIPWEDEGIPVSGPQESPTGASKGREIENQDQETSAEAGSEVSEQGFSSDPGPFSLTEKPMRIKNEKGGRKDRDAEDSEESKKKKGKKNKKSKKKKS